MLDREIKYYENNKKKLRALYEGKYIVIKFSEIVGVYDSHANAYNETIKSHEVGTFIIKLIAKRIAN